MCKNRSDSLVEFVLAREILKEKENIKMGFERFEIKKVFGKKDLLDGDYKILASGNTSVQLPDMEKIGIPSIVSAIKEEGNNPEAYYEIYVLVLEKNVKKYMLKIACSMNAWDYVLEEGIKEECLNYPGCIKNVYDKKEIVLTLKSLSDIMNCSIDYTYESSFKFEEIKVYLENLTTE